TCRSLGEETARAVLNRLGRELERTTRDRPFPGAIGDSEAKVFPHSNWPPGLVRQVIDTQWVTKLDDLVERRLMLLYDRALTVELLHELAGEFVAAGRLAADQVPAAVAACLERLKSHFGRQLASPTAKDLA